MKKMLLMGALLTSWGGLMAQIQLKPQLQSIDSNFLYKPLDLTKITPDANSSLPKDLTNLPRIDLYQLEQPGIQNSRLLTASSARTDRMPVAVLQGKSKMPVYNMKGNDIMPVAVLGKSSIAPFVTPLPKP